MKTQKALLLCASLIACSVYSGHRRAAAEPGQNSAGRLVRIAELEIDPAQLEAYKNALKAEIETSIRIEPGVLTLYAVAVKDHPNQIRLFEVYRDESSYQAHLQTPHFKRYKSETLNRVKSLKLIETEPILLGAKSR